MGPRPGGSGGGNVPAGYCAKFGRGYAGDASDGFGEDDASVAIFFGTNE